MWQNLEELLQKDWTQQMPEVIEDYRKLLDLILSEGLDKIDSLSDDELRKAMTND